MSEVTLCARCGKPIGLGEPRFADVQRATRLMRQVHIGCMTEEPSLPASPTPLHRLSRAIRRALFIGPFKAVDARP